MGESLEKIAKDIKTAREKKGLSQRALSALVRIPQSHISKIERGEVDLQTSSLIEIARALELELVLVSREYLSAIEAMKAGLLQTSKQIPAYRLEEEENHGF